MIPKINIQKLNKNNENIDNFIKNKEKMLNEKKNNEELNEFPINIEKIETLQIKNTSNSKLYPYYISKYENESNYNDKRIYKFNFSN